MAVEDYPARTSGIPRTTGTECDLLALARPQYAAKEAYSPTLSGIVWIHDVEYPRYRIPHPSATLNLNDSRVRDMSLHPLDRASLDGGETMINLIVWLVA